MKGLVAALLGLLLPWHAALAAEPVFSPGSQISLVPPPGMFLDKYYNTFENKDETASITLEILEHKEYPSFASMLTNESLQRDGHEVTFREDLRLGSISGILVRSHVSKDPPRREWIMVVKDSAMAARVIARVEDGQDGFPDHLVEKALKSVSLRGPRPMDELISALVFRIGDMAGFRLVEVRPKTGIILTDGPKDVGLGEEQANIYVSISTIPPPQPGERRRIMAEINLLNRGFWKRVGIERSEFFSRNGQDWYEGISNPVNLPSGKQVLETLTVRYDTHNMIKVEATIPVGTLQADQYLQRIRTILDNVEMKP